MKKITRFEGEKLKYEAQKRDFRRSKLPEGRRLKAMEFGKRIADEHSRHNEKNNPNDEMEFRDGIYDSAIKRAYKNSKDRMEVKRLTL